MSLTDVVASGDEDELLRCAGAVEADSEHPIGQAIASAARERAGTLPPVTNFGSVAGHGVRADADGVTVWVGRRKLAAETGLILPEALEKRAERLEGEGKKAVFAGWDGQVRGVLAVADTLKDEARQAVEQRTGWD